MRSSPRRIGIKAWDGSEEADLSGDDASRPRSGSPRREERTGYRSGDRSRSDQPHPKDGSEPPASSVACDICGAPMLDRHCKLVCLSCGFQRDCSDP